MKILKRTAAYLLAAAILAAGGTAAGAAAESNTDTGFSDVDAGSWYADAVAYVRDNGLMSGTSDTTFEPDGTMTRAMLVTTLYRAADSPPLENEDLGYPFADVPGDAWYSCGRLRSRSSLPTDPGFWWPISPPPETRKMSQTLSRRPRAATCLPLRRQSPIQTRI